MHPHQDICPYDGCGRTHFEAPDALALHCWHAHGTSVLDIGVIQCTWPGCELLRFQQELHLMIHMDRVHGERLAVPAAGLCTGPDGRLKRPRIGIGYSYTDDEIFVYAARQIYYDQASVKLEDEEDGQQPRYVEEDAAPDDLDIQDDDLVLQDDDIYNGHYREEGDRYHQDNDMHRENGHHENGHYKNGHLRDEYDKGKEDMYDDDGGGGSGKKKKPTLEKRRSDKNKRRR